MYIIVCPVAQLDENIPVCKVVHGETPIVDSDDSGTDWNYFRKVFPFSMELAKSNLPSKSTHNGHFAICTE